MEMRQASSGDPVQVSSGGPVVATLSYVFQIANNPFVKWFENASIWAWYMAQ